MLTCFAECEKEGNVISCESPYLAGQTAFQLFPFVRSLNFNSPIRACNHYRRRYSYCQYKIKRQCPCSVTYTPLLFNPQALNHQTRKRLLFIIRLTFTNDLAAVTILDTPSLCFGKELGYWLAVPQPSDVLQIVRYFQLFL